MQDTFFIPQRKRKLSASATESTKKPRYTYNDGVLIFEEPKRKTTEAVIVSDINFEYAETHEELEKKKESALVSAAWAINLYLEPKNVMHMTIYWLSQYVNYRIPESEWFNDHITSLMCQPLALNFSSSKGIAHIHARLPKYTLLIQIAGSGLHKIPSEYFVHKDCIEILECLCYLLEPKNKCFLTRHTRQLMGELSLSTFEYNSILSYFYEPSFLILTSYLVYVHNLLTLPQGRDLASFLPRIKNILKPIEHKRVVAWDKLLSLNKLNSNYDEKCAVFEQDMLDLNAALSEHLSVEGVIEQLTRLWCNKAQYVTDQIDRRFNAIASQLQ